MGRLVKEEHACIRHRRHGLYRFRYLDFSRELPPLLPIHLVPATLNRSPYAFPLLLLPVNFHGILASLNSTYLGPGSETYTISPSGSGFPFFKVQAATIFAIATPGAMLCCRAETLQGTIGLSCRATLSSDFNAKGTPGLLVLEAEFLVHVTSPKGWTAALCKFNLDRLVPEYVCQRDGIEHGTPTCQRVIGDHIDKAVGELLVERMAPLALEVTLSVQQELQTRIEEVDQLRKKQVERARYEADLAQRRYLHVDPANRLVADTLEADWNEKLRALTEAQEQYEQQRPKIAALASDFPRVWQDPKTPDRERKRIVRLLLEDVTLIRNDEIIVHVRFKGGGTKTLTLPRPLTSWELKTTPPADSEGRFSHGSCPRCG